MLTAREAQQSTSPERRLPLPSLWLRPPDSASTHLLTLAQKEWLVPLQECLLGPGPRPQGGASGSRGHHSGRAPCLRGRRVGPQCHQASSGFARFYLLVPSARAPGGANPGRWPGVQTGKECPHSQSTENCLFLFFPFTSLHPLTLQSMAAHRPLKLRGSSLPPNWKSHGPRQMEQTLLRFAGCPLWQLQGVQSEQGSWPQVLRVRGILESACMDLTQTNTTGPRSGVVRAPCLGPDWPLGT